MKTFSMMIRRGWAVPALALLLAGCDGDNLGLETAHKPVIADRAARVEECPDWKGHNRDSAAATMPNYGCATMTNMAAMIFDPQDLVRGKSDTDMTGDAVRAARAWREGAKAGGK